MARIILREGLGARERKVKEEAARQKKGR